MGASHRARGLVVVVVSLACAATLESPAAATEGFFKDVFVDGGVFLTGRRTLAAADHLGLSVEFLATPFQPDPGDLALQTAKLTGDDNDSNGALLYPDGAPRFRLVQTNGGSATRHGDSLEEAGRERMRQFYRRGGSFTGSCAGAFITSLAPTEEGVREAYYHLWPGRMLPTGLLDTATGHVLEWDSPLLDYADFGGDAYVADVFHNGGGWVWEDDPDYPLGTQILARYDYPQLPMHGKPSCIAYKEAAATGRLVVIGGHPEGVRSGERRDLMAAMLEYALDGQGEPEIKGTLEDGVWRTMDRTTADMDPAYTRIGDKQFHHFIVEVPPRTRSLELRLEGDESYDLDLFTRRDGLAFREVATAASHSGSATETITVESPAPGTWYVGVECFTSVGTSRRDWGDEYAAPLGVLEGVAYRLRAALTIAAPLPGLTPVSIRAEQPTTVLDAPTAEAPPEPTESPPAPLAEPAPEEADSVGCSCLATRGRRDSVAVLLVVLLAWSPRRRGRLAER